ncbi:hypothetical protein LCY76_03845 [Fictibacillus sp. KIGAM418]|uniref:Uncharacterized protein n=1 Tax=Fictibacillus marinisediminis TaxID=2878389 RepID=A0A9X1X8B6_9BACL|nr:hypothetical protein [Fictibacillus marinisediminis]MCK6255753.1 hypothetical protein [Fictibacillus marinisediminis]
MRTKRPRLCLLKLDQEMLKQAFRADRRWSTRTTTRPFVLRCENEAAEALPAEAGSRNAEAGV